MRNVGLPSGGTFFSRQRLRQPPTRGRDYVGFVALLLSLGIGCESSEIKPVDIYPEDMCSQCRMAISDQSFAAEILTEAEDVYKFDDLGCMEKFQEKSGELKVMALFVKDYETSHWIPLARSTIVLTSLKTPMGSGRIAFADSAKAKAFLEKFPAAQ